MLQTCGARGSSNTPSGGHEQYDDEYDDYHISDDYKETLKNNQNREQSVAYNNNYDWGVQETPPPLKCYACEFEQLEDGHEEGYKNCNEPFRRDGIPEVTCVGYCSVRTYDRISLMEWNYIHNRLYLRMMLPFVEDQCKRFFSLLVCAGVTLL